MIELLPLAETAQLPIESAPELGNTETLSILKDGAISLGLIWAVKEVLQLGTLGYLLPESVPDIDDAAVTRERDPKLLTVIPLLYVVGTLATTAGAYVLTQSAGLTAMWFGGLAFLGCLGSVLTFRGNGRLDHGRLLAEARRSE